MKRNIILFVAAAFTLLLAASCNRKYEYEFTRYATLYHTEYSVPETVGELRIPVLINNTDGSEVQVTVKVEDVTALADVDYEVVSPSNGILTFSGETDSLDVVLNIVSYEGKFTGNKSLTVSIASATEGLIMGHNTVANVLIQDLDHPLAPLAGSWAGTVNFATNPPTPLPATLNFAIDEKDDTYTKMILTGWEAHPSYGGYALPVVATYNKENTTIYVTAGQAAWGVDGYGFVFYGFDGSNAVDLELKYDEASRTLTQMNYYGCYSTAGDDQGWWSLYEPGAVFTKK